MDNIDFNNERELRMWCIKQAFSLHDKYSVDEAIKTSARIYDFIAGVKNVEIIQEEGTMKKIIVPHGFSVEISRGLS